MKIKILFSIGTCFLFFFLALGIAGSVIEIPPEEGPCTAQYEAKELPGTVIAACGGFKDSFAPTAEHGYLETYAKICVKKTSNNTLSIYAYGGTESNHYRDAQEIQFHKNVPSYDIEFHSSKNMLSFSESREANNSLTPWPFYYLSLMVKTQLVFDLKLGTARLVQAGGGWPLSGSPQQFDFTVPCQILDQENFLNVSP